MQLLVTRTIGDVTITRMVQLDPPMKPERQRPADWIMDWLEGAPGRELTLASPIHKTT